MINLHQLPNQERGEKPVLFIRRHWVEVLSIFGYLIAMLAVPVLLVVILSTTGTDLLNHEFFAPLLAAVISAYLLIVTLIAMTMYTDFYLDTWIVTSERIINIEQHGLFKRVISTLHLNQVQDVTAETAGFWATFLSYGNVYVQTAGTRERFNFKQIDDPEAIKNKILFLVHQDKQRHGDASQKAAFENNAE
ncbi:MAG: PH domain-containing protein [Patescibacteria group bacterium]